VVVFVALGRPLIFASLDEGVAAARGVPVRALGYAFFILLGVTAGVATQAVGALLLLGLVAAPAGASQRLTSRPFVAVWLSAGIAVVSMWIGLTVSYLAPKVPPSFGILAVATATYLGAIAATSGPTGRRLAMNARRTARSGSDGTPADLAGRPSSADLAGGFGGT